MQSFTPEADTLPIVRGLTNSPVTLVRDTTAGELFCDALAIGLPLGGLNLDDLPDFNLEKLPDFDLTPNEGINLEHLTGFDLGAIIP